MGRFDEMASRALAEKEERRIAEEKRVADQNEERNRLAREKQAHIDAHVTPAFQEALEAFHRAGIGAEVERLKSPYIGEKLILGGRLGSNRATLSVDFNGARFNMQVDSTNRGSGVFNASPDNVDAELVRAIQSTLDRFTGKKVGD